MDTSSPAEQRLTELEIRSGFAEDLLDTLNQTVYRQQQQIDGLLDGGVDFILIETVFAWPGTGFLLNSAIFQRDLPLLQGTILVLAMFFVVLNLLVDVLQTLLDPRIARA